MATINIKAYRILKGALRIHMGFSLVRVWSLDRVYPGKTVYTCSI